MAQQPVRQPQAAGGQQGGGVFGESVVGQAELGHPPRQAAGVRRFPRVGPPRLQPHIAEVLQEEADGGRRQVEAQAVQDDALQVAELLAGEGAAAEGEELLHAGGVHLHLPGEGGGRDDTEEGMLQPRGAARGGGKAAEPGPAGAEPAPQPLGVAEEGCRDAGGGAAGLRGRPTCLQAMSSAVTPRSWKQSAATGVVARKRSRMLTARQSASKERPKCRCTGMSQLTSLQRASAVTCGTGSGGQAGLAPGLPPPAPRRRPRCFPPRPPTCGCRASGSRGWKRLSSPLRERYQLSP